MKTIQNDPEAVMQLIVRDIHTHQQSNIIYISPDVRDMIHELCGVDEEESGPLQFISGIPSAVDEQLPGTQWALETLNLRE